MRILAILILLPAAIANATAQVAPSALDKVLNASARNSSLPTGISDGRAQVLKALASGLGTRAGLSDASRAILEEIQKDKIILDERFNFGALTFSNGALPPVIEETQDVVSVTEYAMRVAGKVYRIVAPASFQTHDWRSYLFLGLTLDDDPLVQEEQAAALPRDEKEQAYWQKLVREAYEAGRRQARSTFEVNLKRLERDFNGMRLFYALHARGLVSAPQFAVATETVSRPDPNTIIIGDSVFRITAQPNFETDSQSWKATK